MPLELESAVGRLLGVTGLRVEDVRRVPLDYDAFLAGRALTRVLGRALFDRGGVTWSFIEKCTDGPSAASPYLYDNGLREFAAYRSGLLEDLAPGVHAPALLAAEEGEDGRLTLWIEDLGGGARSPQSPEEIVRAARDLGRLSARWLDRVPDHAWLFHGWIERHSQPHAQADALALMNAARGDARIEGPLEGRLEEATRLVADQEEYAAALRLLPRTLCHHDAVAANVFAREAADGHETVLIDWESVGPGPVGADLASLLFASPRRGDFSALTLPDVVPDALAAYSDGLAEMGASLDPRDVRLGVHASIALRWALARDVVRLLGGTGVPRRGSAPGESPDQALAELVALVPVLLDSAAEARRLTASH